MAKVVRDIALLDANWLAGSFEFDYQFFGEAGGRGARQTRVEVPLQMMLTITGGP